MKLYNLFESVILEETINIHRILAEGVSGDAVMDSLGKYDVKISYRDVGQNAPSQRTIQVYVYGQLQNGNDAIRAYQVDGPSFHTGDQHNWKIFRLDRITSWTPTKKKIHKAVSDYNKGLPSDVPDYESQGDQKGNFRPGEKVDTFKKIYAQYNSTGTITKPIIPIEKPVTPTEPKAPVVEPKVKLVVPNTPVKKPEVPAQAPVKKPVVKPIEKPIAPEVPTNKTKAPINKQPEPEDELNKF